MYALRTHGTFALLVLSGLLAVACPGSLEDPERFQIGLTDGPTTCPPGFDVDQQIFQKTCASSICHDSDMPEGELDLSSPATWSALVGKPSADPDCATKLLIDPNNPEQSFMLEKVALKKPACGDQMPNVPQKLTAAEVDCVRKWVQQVLSDGGGSGGSSSGGSGGGSGSGGASGGGGASGSSGDSGS